MQPQLGWVWLSREERRAAEAALADLGPDGTRDELGFGVIHFAYADRFFPGTSVQHTSLRYVWFVCWIYQELAARHGGGGFPMASRCAMEDQVGHKLLDFYGPVDGTGIIGGRVLRMGRSPVTKPSAVYWNAMRMWGLISPLQRNGEPPARSELEWRWDELTGRHERPEVDAVEHHSLFVDPPPAPKAWLRAGELTFELDESNGEASRIRKAWRAQRDPFDRQTLLSRLAERKVPAPKRMAQREVLALCLDQHERDSLVRAERAGALAAIARALHTHLVQGLKPGSNDLTACTRKWVDDAVESYGQDASLLDLSGLRGDVPALGTLQILIEATQLWLAKGAGDLASLEPIYRAREMEQRPGRALLAIDAGARRDTWGARERYPLTYRWEKVRGFLGELAV